MSLSVPGRKIKKKPALERAVGTSLDFLRLQKLVEAAGVEPASEKANNREHSCFFRFIFVSSSTLRTDEDAPTTSLIDLVIAVQTEQL